MEVSRELDLVLKNDYKVDQEKVLNQIKVFDLSEIQNPNYKRIISENEKFYGLKVYGGLETKSSDKIMFRKGKNNIGIIQTIESSGEMSEIYDPIIIDFESKKCFSVEDLNTILGDEDRLGLSSIFYTNNLFSTSSYSPERSRFSKGGQQINEGGSVVWNEDENQKKLLDLKFGSGSGNVVSFLSLFHEFGHRYQMGYGSEGKSFSMAMDVKKEMSKKENVEQFAEDKQKIGESERNAWAFSLAVARNLKNKGVDILRDFDNYRVEKIINFALSTYDMEFKKIPGGGISNKERAKERQKNKIGL